MAAMSDLSQGTLPFDALRRQHCQISGNTAIRCHPTAYNLNYSDNLNHSDNLTNYSDNLNHSDNLNYTLGIP